MSDYCQICGKSKCETPSICEGGLRPFPKQRYIGDGVTAYYDGFQVILQTPRDSGINEVALEPDVFKALTVYVKDLPGEAPYYFGVRTRREE